jgi:predicted lipoprotein
MPMPKTSLKYAVLLILLGVVAYNSVYFKKLDDVKASSGSTSKFDPVAYAQTYWNSKLLPATSTATDFSTLIALLKTDKEKAVETYSHALGIGNIRYFLVKGEGKLTAIGDNDVTVSLPSGETVNLATEYIFGNAVRDASGLIKITEFDNTMDLNNVSAELNAIIRKKVVPPFRASAKVGSTVKFVGAIELNREHLHLDDVEVIPISVNSH